MRIEGFLTGLVLGAVAGALAERYTRTTSRGRKIRREVNHAIADAYGAAEQQIGRAKEIAVEQVDAILSKVKK